MKKQYLMILILLISIIEIFVFVFSKSITINNTIYWQLAARYSARITFYILCIILFWVGIKGLKGIYLKEKTRILFVTLLLLLAINHLIHFYFIYKNFEINNHEWIKLRHVAGLIVYPILIVSPFYLWSQSKLNKKLYWLVYLFLTPTFIVFTVSYIGRLTNDLPYRSSNILFFIHLFLIASMLIINIRRVYLDHK